MILLILTLLAGMIAGRLLSRRVAALHAFASRALMPVLLVLLFFMGVSLGANRAVAANLHRLGLEAMLITLGALGGTILFSSWLWRIAFKNSVNAGNSENSERSEHSDNSKSSDHSNLSDALGSMLPILIMLAAGAVAGRWGLVDEEWAAKGSVIVLYALLTVVGLYVGSGRELADGMRRQSARVLLVPLATVVGSLVGAATVAPLLTGRTLAQCLAVASGFGYYSLSAILINGYCGADLGLVALISNVARELTVLLFAPLMVRAFNPLTPICLGGATSMDSTLPSIVRASGAQYLLVALLHGIVVDSLVPLLVTLFVG